MSRLGKISFLFAAISFVSMILVWYLIGEWVPYCWVAFGLSAFFAGAGFYFDRAVLTEFFTLKTTKHGMNMGVLILLVFAFLVVVNFLAVRNYKTFDFSLGRSNTLSPQSIQLLNGLDSDLKVYFFYKKGVEGNEENRRLFRELVKKYQDRSDKVQLNFVEVNERPDLAKDFGVDRGSGIVFLDYKGRRNRMDKIDEQDMSSALVKVTRETKKVLYFVSGHGEKNTEEVKDAQGLNALKQILENNSYEVKNVALNQVAQVPEDADLLIIVGPQRNFLDFEIVSLENYLKRGGSVFLALSSQQTAGLDGLLARLGLKAQNNYILSVETLLGKQVAQGLTLGSVFSSTSDITKNFGKDEVILLLHPMGLSRVENPPLSVSIDDIVRTNGSSIAYKTLEFKGDTVQGPFTIMSTVKGQFPSAKEKKNEKTAKDSKAKDFALFVSGDANFLNNQMLYKNLNRDLVLNTVASLVKEENLISITGKEPQKTELILTQTRFTLFIFAFIIPLPLLLLATSIGLWMRRRNA